MRRSILYHLCAIALFFSGCSDNSKIQLGKNSNQEVIKAMTLEEKAYLLVGNDPGFPRGYPSGFGGADTLFSSDPPVVGQTKKIVPGAAGTTYGIPRLGIPAIVLADGPAGVRIDPTRPDTSKTFYATVFPIESLLACSWDTAVVKQVGQCMGNEALEYGVDVLLAPALNIHRNPLGGRNFEYYSEDPLLSGEMAAAMVNGVQSEGVGTSIKHFAANNNETNRMSINARIDEKTLQETYLKGFEIAIQKSHPWTVMSAYNKINGVYCSENPVLLDSILRKNWGFEGVVMTDWFAGRERFQQVRAGNDLLMPGSTYIAQKIVEAVKNGDLDEKYVDRNVDRILDLVKKTPRFKKYAYSDTPDLKSHADVAELAAEEGIVLLKNDTGMLPFSDDVKTIAAFGIGTYQTIAVGTGSGNVNSAYTISLNDGLLVQGYEIPKELKGIYADYVIKEKKRVGDKSSYFQPDIMLKEKNWSVSDLTRYASSCDAALFTISRTSGEFADRKIEDDFELTKEEMEMIHKLSKLFHAQKKKLVVVLNVGGVIETASWKNMVDAILLVWQPGQEGGNAIAKILNGEVNPSGKLAMTFPVCYGDVPSANYFPDPAKDPVDVDYTEGEYVGYKHYVSKGIKTSFEFGYGLSYTSFDIKNIVVSKNTNGGYDCSITIHNTGDNAGKEVVQLYVKGAKSAVKLKNFAKTKTLKPGESEVIHMNLKGNAFSSYNVEKSEWEVLPGKYQIMVGNSSENIWSLNEVEIK